MLYPAHNRIGRRNLVLRHSVPHFPPNSGYLEYDKRSKLIIQLKFPSTSVLVRVTNSYKSRSRRTEIALRPFINHSLFKRSQTKNQK